MSFCYTLPEELQLFSGITKAKNGSVCVISDSTNQPVWKTGARDGCQQPNRYSIALKSRHNQPRCFSRATALGPCLIRHSSASVLLSPPVIRVLSLASLLPGVPYVSIALRYEESMIPKRIFLLLG